MSVAARVARRIADCAEDVAVMLEEASRVAPPAVIVDPEPEPAPVAAPAPLPLAIHLLGQSNATRRIQGPGAGENRNGMRYVNGTLVEDETDPYSVGHVLANLWTDLEAPTLIEQATGSLSIPLWMDRHLDAWRADVAAVGEARHLIVWIQGEAEAWEWASSRSKGKVLRPLQGVYRERGTELFGAFRETLPDAIIVDVLLSADVLLSQRFTANHRPNSGQIRAEALAVNEAKRELSEEFGTILIGGSYGLEHFNADRVHYGPAGAQAIARDVIGAAG